MYKVHDKVRVAPSGKFGLITGIDQDANMYMVAMHGLMDSERLSESDLALINEEDFEKAKDIIDNLDRIELFAKVKADKIDDTRIFMQISRDSNNGESTNILLMTGKGSKEEVAKLSTLETKGFLDKLKGIGLEQIDEKNFKPVEDDTMDGFKWRLALYAGIESVAVSGNDAYPTQLPELYRLFESYGVPKVWDNMTNGPYCKHSVD